MISCLRGGLATGVNLAGVFRPMRILPVASDLVYPCGQSRRILSAVRRLSPPPFTGTAFGGLLAQVMFNPVPSPVDFSLNVPRSVTGGRAGRIHRDVAEQITHAARQRPVSGLFFWKPDRIRFSKSAFVVIWRCNDGFSGWFRRRTLSRRGMFWRANTSTRRSFSFTRVRL